MLLSFINLSYQTLQVHLNQILKRLICGAFLNLKKKINFF